MKFPRKNVALYAFLPWVAFWSQGGSVQPDLSRIRVALAPSNSSCKKVIKTFNVTIARTNASRGRGLMDRSSPLAEGEGMLFVFDAPKRASFWMKNTLIPLDIAFFDTAATLSEIVRMPVEKQPSNPDRVYESKSSRILVALEVRPGSLNGMGAKVELCADSLAPR